MAGYMHGRGREVSCQEVLRRTLNPSSLRAATSWRSRTCRRTGTILVKEEREGLEDAIRGKRGETGADG